MKLLPLTNGQFSIVDDEDFDFLSQWKWKVVNGYVYRTEHGKGSHETRKTKSFYLHRVVNKTPNGMETDHINGDKLDNKKINLRTVSSAQNKFNIGSKGGSSKFKGVNLNKGKWRACIMINRKQIYLGAFSSEEDAAQAYNFAAAHFHGEHAKFNVVAS